MFTNLLEHIKYEVVSVLFKVQVRQEEDVQALDQQMQAPKEMHFEHAEAPPLDIIEDQQLQPSSNNDEIASAVNELPFVRQGDKVGRNDPCTCGSGKKFKHCHGKLD